MNSLYYVSGYDPKNNGYWRFAVTVHISSDGWPAAESKVREHYPQLSSFRSDYLCKTPDYVFTEL